jgi:hypothetical protein
MIPWFERPVIYDVRARPSLIQSQSGSRDLQMVGKGRRGGGGHQGYPSTEWLGLKMQLGSWCCKDRRCAGIQRARLQGS